jgi:hypothetical protein
MARVNRYCVRRVENAASEDAVLIRQREGSVKAFDRTQVMGELYLARLAAALGREPQSSEFVDALANATPESRAAVLALDEGHYEDLEPAEEASGPPPDLSE